MAYHEPYNCDFFEKIPNWFNIINEKDNDNIVGFVQEEEQIQQIIEIYENFSHASYIFQ